MIFLTVVAKVKMTDWTVIATAIAVGVTSVLAAIVGAWIGASSARRQLEAQLSEERFRKRVEAYQEFLDTDRQLQTLMIPPTVADGAFNKWNVDFDHAFNSVLLLGTETARAHVREFASVIPKKLPVATGWPEIRDAYWSLFHDELEALRASVLDAMRKDVLESQLLHHPRPSAGVRSSTRSD